MSLRWRGCGISFDSRWRLICPELWIGWRQFGSRVTRIWIQSDADPVQVLFPGDAYLDITSTRIIQFFVVLRGIMGQFEKFKNRFVFRYRVSTTYKKFFLLDRVPLRNDRFNWLIWFVGISSWIFPMLIFVSMKWVSQTFFTLETMVHNAQCQN